jgi:phenylalanyl-tRNA synthetase beta chain
MSASSPIAVVEAPESYSVQVPTWRLDVEREIDVIEEIARVYGYNNFANTLPAFAGGVVELPHARAESSLRARLLALGYDEAVSNTFISSADAQRFASETAVRLENPLSDEAPVLRTTLVPGMLQMLAWNFNRDVRDLRLFEMGHIFDAIRNRVVERAHVCFAATGAAAANDLERKARALDFFDLKGDAEDLLSLFAAESVRFDAPGTDYYHPGRSAKIVLDKKVVGQLGQLHPDIAAARKFKQDVWLAEFDLERLFAVPLREARYEKLSRFPQVERDFSVLLDNAVKYETLRRSLEALHIPELRSMEPRELFRGGNVPEGKYSMLLHLIFQSAERTLRDEEVAAWSQQIIAAIQALGGSLRG